MNLISNNKKNSAIYWKLYVFQSTLVQRASITTKTKSKDSHREHPQGGINPNWIAGFTDGDGSFVLIVYKDKRIGPGKGVQFKWNLTQHENCNILEKINDYFQDSGKIYRQNNAKSLVIGDKKSLREKVIPF